MVISIDVNLINFILNNRENQVVEMQVKDQKSSNGITSSKTFVNVWFVGNKGKNEVNIKAGRYLSPGSILFEYDSLRMAKNVNQHLKYIKVTGIEFHEQNKPLCC